MKFIKTILCGVLMIGVGGDVFAQAPETDSKAKTKVDKKADSKSEDVAIRFTLCLLPINKDAYFDSGKDSNGAGIAIYNPPSLSYDNGVKMVNFKITHGHSKRKLTYRGAPTLKFYGKVGSAGVAKQVASVEINPKWKNILLIAVSDSRGQGTFKLIQMNFDALKLESGEIYMYNLTPETLLSAIGKVKHRLRPLQLKRFNCSLAATRVQRVLMVARREGGVEKLFNKEMAFSRKKSNLLLVYYEKEDPKRPRFQLLRGVSL